MTLLNPQKRTLPSTNSFAAPFFGRNAQMSQIRRNLELLAQTDLPVLLQGESGTGKNFVAELLHGQTESAGELVRLNCSAPLVLHGSEGLRTDGGSLFSSSLQSALQNGGTLLLDGVHELDLQSQGNLLLFLKERDAGVRGPAASARLRMVSVTTQEMQELVDAGRFRADLLYRINAVKLTLPPLRQRPEDIPGLASYFLQTYAGQEERSSPVMSSAVADLIKRYSWPGNIRQLGNVIRNFVLVGSDSAISRELMEPQRPMGPGTLLDQLDLSRPIALKEITKEFTLDLERQIILRVLQANGWNRQKTAKWLQISYRSLLYKLSDATAAQDREKTAVPVPLRALGS